ncbi:MAG: (Fe-S)-binding protein [Syntrophorhabdaceae bacterium]|nr:(Fe-S)-binding protein [Syntrophorhabdaceae bacterium]
MSLLNISYLGISGYVIFWGMFVIALFLFSRRIYFLYKVIRLGKGEDRFDRIGERIKYTLSTMFSQRCTLKSIKKGDLAGIGHALLFWGFSCFFISYIILIGFAEGFGMQFLRGGTFERAVFTVLDIAGLFVIFCILWAAVRRYLIKPDRLEMSFEAGFIMSMVLSLMVLYYAIESCRFALMGESSRWPPISMAIATYLLEKNVGQATLWGVFVWSWWLHYIFILVFMVYIPYSKHLHILVSPFNLMFKPMDRKVLIEPVSSDMSEEEMVKGLGISGIQDLKWKDILDVFACAKCGRCHINCPAQLSGKILSPREFIKGIKEHTLEVAPLLLGQNGDKQKEERGKTFIDGKVKEEEIWACTTCGLCQEVCPVEIEHVRKLIGLRQNLVLEKNTMPEGIQNMLRNMQMRGNPWAGAQSLRLKGDWINEAGMEPLKEGDGISTLLWVGCTGSLIDRNVKATISLAELLKRAGIKFGVLGEGEPCCGDPARRAGYDFQFQILAEENREILRSYNIKEIITSCPHCYNTLKNEYPLYGLDLKIIHYTELLCDLVKRDKLSFSKTTGSLLTYHDPCYLSRYNGIYQEPRTVIGRIPDVRYKEMERSCKETFCCGGGGAHMWIEEKRGTTRINHLRIEEVTKTGANAVITSCPYCLQMLEEGIESKGLKGVLEAKELSEVLLAAMEKT